MYIVLNPTSCHGSESRSQFPHGLHLIQNSREWDLRVPCGHSDDSKNVVGRAEEIRTAPLRSLRPLAIGEPGTVCWAVTVLFALVQHFKWTLCRTRYCSAITISLCFHPVQLYGCCVGNILCHPPAHARRYPFIVHCIAQWKIKSPRVGSPDNSIPHVQCVFILHWDWLCVQRVETAGSWVLALPEYDSRRLFLSFLCAWSIKAGLSSVAALFHSTAQLLPRIHVGSLSLRCRTLACGSFAENVHGRSVLKLIFKAKGKVWNGCI